MIKTLTLSTHKKQEMVDITKAVGETVRNCGISSGVCHIFIPHTTAGVAINENYDPHVGIDFLATMERLVPTNGEYLHAEGNSHAHIKSILTGSNGVVFFEGGNLMLGDWQGIFLVEFDGPRTRRVVVRMSAG